ncbi:putative BTB/POZ domain-containing protein 1 [Hypsibius exemplaris]|uniref:BTB/POZ domain-containing protein 1 n=1 Tax=Hypsibius exemplaris TaxID=2072580 RepID=A0A9X6NI07_HYPEX|nr:putative BTB/POZ domain-containing protein 1 [Hypsibius exemplaris]
MAATMSDANWQQSQRDTSSAIKYLFDSNDTHLSDVSFKLTNAAGKMEVVKAHKLILACRSSVFEAMFYGPLAESSALIPVEDITAEIFKTALWYIYKDDANCLNGENVLPLLYVAHKYDIGSLKELCANITAQSITSDIVFHCIQQAELYDSRTLADACYSFVDKNTIDLLGRPEFLNQPRKVLNSILMRSTLAADGMPELCIFKAAVRWAKAEADRSKIPEKLTRIREALAESLYLIRFPHLTPTEIAQARKDGILSDREAADLLEFLHQIHSDPKPFIKEPRANIDKRPLWRGMAYHGGRVHPTMRLTHNREPSEQTMRHQIHNGPFKKSASRPTEPSIQMQPILTDRRHLPVVEVDLNGLPVLPVDGGPWEELSFKPGACDICGQPH